MNYLIQPEYLRHPPAWFHPRILVGAGSFLRVGFADQHKITHVINCAFAEYSPEWFREINPNSYVCLEAIDGLDQNILTWYPKFEETMQRFLREGDGTIYVHCQAGMNRSAFLALVYVCKHFHMELGSTIQSTKRQRPCMFTNTTFRGQVEEFINGHLQSQESSREFWRDNDGRYIRLGPPRDSPEPERFKIDARYIEARIIRSSKSIVNPVRFQ